MLGDRGEGVWRLGEKTEMGLGRAVRRGPDLWGRGRALLPVVSLSGPPLAKPSLLAGGNVHQSTFTSLATFCTGASRHRKRRVNVG